MTEDDKETTTAGSDRIPERGSDGAAGTSPDVANHDHEPSGAEGTGHKAPFLVERKTGLRGRGIAPVRILKSTIRKYTEDDLRGKNPEVPYHAAERIFRDLICSLLERQDRMNEEILLRLIDLEYRMDDLESDYAPRRKRSTGTEAVPP